MKPDQQVSEKHPTISDTQRDAFLMQWIRDAISDGTPFVFRQSARTLDPDTETTWRTLTIEEERPNLPCGKYVNIASAGTEDDAHDLLEECIVAAMTPEARAEYMARFNKDATTPHVVASVEHGENPKGQAIAAATEALVRQANRYAVDATHSVINVQWALDALRDAVEAAQGVTPSFRRDAARVRAYAVRMARLADDLEATHASPTGDRNAE